MAAKGVSRTEHYRMAAEKVKARKLMERLQQHALGEIAMAKTEIMAANILLKKVLPDLKATEHSGEVRGIQSINVNLF